MCSDHSSQTWLLSFKNAERWPTGSIIYKHTDLHPTTNRGRSTAPQMFFLKDHVQRNMLIGKKPQQAGSQYKSTLLLQMVRTMWQWGRSSWVTMKWGNLTGSASSTMSWMEQHHQLHSHLQKLLYSSIKLCAGAPLGVGQWKDQGSSNTLPTEPAEGSTDYTSWRTFQRTSQC